MNRAELAARIDHTLLKPDATAAQIREACAEARAAGCAAMCVNGGRVALARQALAGSRVAIAAVVGFPLGAMATEVKAAEAARALADGASEIDMVMQLGAFRDGDHEWVKRDVAAVVAASGAALVKVILETGLLADEEKVKAALLAVAAGAHFVKTSTGFGGGGATVADVRLLRQAVGTRARIKASGGIKDAPTALALIEAGADRLGMSATAAVLAGLA
ncbi:MAG: deoxyribose-phosphate aldolase [Planctomycetes bacterium]|nr:deoxyribose-phosphate aldolase [Planctomycetota bacterium]